MYGELLTATKMTQLYSHQKKIIDDDPKKCGLWLGTGSGKTRIALLLARGKTLIIVPKTQFLDENWQREKEKLGLDIDITVISKETFRRDYKSLPRYDTVIGEEAHTLLGVTPNIKYIKREPYPATSQLFSAFKDYVEYHKPERVYLATATIVKSPMTVWGASKILGYNWNWYEFRSVFYIERRLGFRTIWIPKSSIDIKERLATLVKKTGYTGRLEDFFDVPEQTYRTIYIELTDEQKKRLKDIHLDFPDPIVQIGKRNQIENGVLKGDEFNPSEEFKNNKLEKILELAIEFPKMIVFAKYTAQIYAYEKALKEEGYKVFILTGATKDRGQLLKDVNDSKEYILICQAQVSAGWEVPDCPCMVFASRTYSFVDYDQAIGRIQRANNIKKNIYINLITKDKGGTIDEAVDKCLENKCDFNETIYAEKRS